MAALRQLGTLAVSATLSWWLFLGFDLPRPLSATAPAPEPLPVVLTPVPLPALAQAAAPEPEAEPAPPDDERAAPEHPPADAPQVLEAVSAADDGPEGALDPEPAPPPAELGAPDGEGELAAAERADEADALAEGPAASAVSAEQAMADEALLAAARSELAGDVRPGFATVLLAAPEEQLDIARFFGEEVVLVPTSAFDASSTHARWFRLELDGEPRVVSVAGTAALEGYRQYRDLFDYEYARLPPAVRELRRSVLSRGEIYLFGALIPAREWAVVMERRREALQRAGRDAADAERFVLRYRPRPRGGFDLEVEEIAFTDGTRSRPPRPATSQESP